MRNLLTILAVVVLAGAVGVYVYAKQARRAAVATIVTPATRVQPAAARIPAGRPNILLVSLDTLRPDHLGVYGHARDTSPRLDAFAASAVVFTQARAQSPWTLPSHMSLFTSMLPSHNGVDNLNNVLSEEFVTLPQLLREAGYHTAALVNNGQMKAHWGFDRGFEQWREFEVDTPEGRAESITNEALAWLRTQERGGGDDPWFLFLHYYDAHDPYDAPQAQRTMMETTLDGDAARRLAWEHRFPAGQHPEGRDIEDPRLLEDLRRAYDAEILCLDAHLGRLLEAVPPDTLVVVFSDHGEAFEEHGWTLHGATLYEEELRVPLIVRLPLQPSPSGRGQGEGSSRGAPQDSQSPHPGPLPMGEGVGQRIDDPVMLLDVAPTILTLANVRPPMQFQGLDLTPLIEGRVLRQRVIPSETKAVLEGRILYAVTLPPLKSIYSLFDGRVELYQLPDEQTDIAAREPQAVEAMMRYLRGWVSEGDYWMVHAHGRGDFEVTIEATDGRFALFVPIGLDAQRDSFDVSEDGRTLRWHVYPGGGTKSLYLQPSNPDAPLRLDFKINGQRAAERVFINREGTQAESLPAELTLLEHAVSPVIERPFEAPAEGFHVRRHRGRETAARPSRVAPLDQQTIDQLRQLGYLQ